MRTLSSRSSFDIKTENDFFGTDGDLLGHAVSLRQFPYIIGPKPERVNTMCVSAQEALCANHLSQAQAGKLAGKNTFSCSALAGKVGRAPNKALYARQHMPLGWSTRLSRNLRFSLKWIRDSLPYANFQFHKKQKMSIAPKHYNCTKRLSKIK